jgi:hypothetical protein
MKPLAPEVVGPVSVCSKSIEVKGNIAGATVEIRVGGQTVSSQVSTNPDDLYPVGVALTAGYGTTSQRGPDERG